MCTYIYIYIYVYIYICIYIYRYMGAHCLHVRVLRYDDGGIRQYPMGLQQCIPTCCGQSRHVRVAATWVYTGGFRGHGIEYI